MHLKTPTLLLTTLTASTALARLHGHERRHHHQERGLGDTVIATIDGKIVSWANNFAGGGGAAPTTTTSSSANENQQPNTAVPDTVSVATTAAAAAPTADSPPSSPEPAGTESASAAAATATTSAHWTSTPADGNFTRKGFGAATKPGGFGIFYKGNVGDPWGSNIIEVPASEASNYKHVAEFSGKHKEPWTIVFWNKIGPDGKMDGWFGKSALKITLQPGETKYVAFDDDSQGGWAAAKGEKIPTNWIGEYAATWGEFDLSSSANSGWSGWDVSSIQAQLAGLEVQGMKICDHVGDSCSSISNAAKSIINAYTQALKGKNGIGGSKPGGGAVRLTVEIDFE